MAQPRRHRLLHAVLALAMFAALPAPASVTGAASMSADSEMPCGDHANGATRACCPTDCTLTMAGCIAACALAPGALPKTLAYVAVTATLRFDHGVTGLAPPALTTPPLLRPPAR